MSSEQGPKKPDILEVAEILGISEEDAQEELESGGQHSKFGCLRRKYLQEYKETTFAAYVAAGELEKHLAVLAWQARERKDLIVEQMKKAEGVNQKLQEKDWMEYVRRLQMIELEAERIVLEEMVYV